MPVQRLQRNPWRNKRRQEKIVRGREDPAHLHHHVYVVLLDPAAAKLRALLKANPQRDPAKPCLYVGMTGLKPSARFDNHKEGYKAAYVVKEFGIRLLPELYECYNPMPFEAAALMERELAEDLRAQGYTVAGGC